MRFPLCIQCSNPVNPWQVGNPHICYLYLQHTLIIFAQIRDAFRGFRLPSERGIQ